MAEVKDDVFRCTPGVAAAANERVGPRMQPWELIESDTVAPAILSGIGSVPRGAGAAAPVGSPILYACPIPHSLLRYTA
jgi:hypothetical protein